MPIFEAANLWFEQPHLARAKRIAAGLCDFGFVEQQGRGRSRKLRVTELGWRAKHFDTPAGVYAVREGISRSRLILHYARVWQAGIPPPDLAVKQLRRELGFDAKRAARFLVVFYQCFDSVRIPVKTIGDPGGVTDPDDRDPVRPEHMRATDS